jgi:outer membrane protein assembly factor BamB
MQSDRVGGGDIVELLFLVTVCLFLSLPLTAGDQPQWGERFTRNMVSRETGLPSSFDLETGRNIKWSVSLGRNCYALPAIAEGKILVGADNAEPRDPRHQGDRAVLLCLDESDGSLLWQLVIPRTGGDIFLDWPNISLCSVPTIENGRAYMLTNRFEVVCLDLDGQADGNDGPYLEEGAHMAPVGERPLEVTALDADIIWLVDLPRDIGTYPHDSSFTSILVRGPYLYLNTCNGVDNTHRRIRRPDAPSLIVLEKETGRLVARDEEGIGPRIFHSTWSSPALGKIGGTPVVFFCGGDGVCYGFRAVDANLPPGPPRRLERLWRLDPDPDSPKANVHEYHQNRRVSPSNVKSMPVVHEDRLYVTRGGDIWWGKNESWLECLDTTKTGDLTRSGKLWSYRLGPHCCSTPAIADGLVFVPDCGGELHCVDAKTGEAVWTHELRRDVWGSALVADGKVYVGSNRGDFWVLKASRDKEVLANVQLDSPLHTTPVAANGVLYLATHRTLYAIQEMP